MGLLAYIEAFELQRFALLADEWDAQVTIVDMPGCGYGDGRLSRDERCGLWRGDFDALAYRMVAAARQHQSALCTHPITMVGYSVGASVAASATKLFARLEHLVLVEPVAVRGRGLRRLLGAVKAENATLDRYLACNSDWPHLVEPMALRRDIPAAVSRADIAAIGWGLSRGRIVADLIRPRAGHPAVVQLVHGAQSRLVTPSDILWAANRCRRAGIDATDVVVPGGHALWHSLPDVQSLARRVAAQW
jgi:pimeloyl-ACP methyl ester carboxylesterase